MANLGRCPGFKSICAVKDKELWKKKLWITDRSNEEATKQLELEIHYEVDTSCKCVPFVWDVDVDISSPPTIAFAKLTDHSIIQPD